MTEEADDLILAVFRKNAGGSAWLSRQWLEHELIGTGLMSQRKLDHRLRSLVKSKVLVSRGDHSTGAVWAMKEACDKDAFLAGFAEKGRRRGATSVAIKVPPAGNKGPSVVIPPAKEKKKQQEV